MWPEVVAKRSVDVEAAGTTFLVLPHCDEGEEGGSICGKSYLILAFITKLGKLVSLRRRLDREHVDLLFSKDLLSRKALLLCEETKT